MFRLLLLLLLAPALLAGAAPAPPLRTPYERDPAHNTTATYAECIAFYQELATAYPTQARLREAGPTDAGRPLHELVLSADGTFTPEGSRAKGRPVVFIQNGIHPGEPEGIDASMMLARDLLQDPRLTPLLGRLTVVVLPVYNVGGMLNRNATTRANQNGPAAYGFRGNDQYLDLNRDFIKQDSRNARSWARLFGAWRPELFVDTHTSNGADYQYTMTLIASQHDKLAPALGKYMQESLLPALYKGMERKQWPMSPYVDFDGETPFSGLRGFLDSPRYSTGYAALFNCLGFMPEAHMLKAFSARVQATYDLLTTFLTTAADQAPALLAARADADRGLAGQHQFALAWALRDTASSRIVFQGYAAGHKPSAVSGLPRLYYDRGRLSNRLVDFFNDARPTVVVQAPDAYLIPAAWATVLERLRGNGVVLRRLTHDYLGSTGQGYVVGSYKTAPRPYEGHYPHSAVQLEAQPAPRGPAREAGAYLAVLAEQGPAKRYLVETLEPQATDSFFAWNYFDAILQAKEHYSDYVFEDLAAAYLKAHPEVREQLDAAKKADAPLAASASAQLEWVYQHSPYAEPDVRRYPVLRLTGQLPVAVPE